MDNGNGQAEKQLVVFNLASEAYGVDIGAVREIVRMQEVTRVPRTPEFVEGVINLRGKVIPVVDLRRRFGLPVGEKNKDNRTVVVDINGQDIGIIVDAVTEVLRIPVSCVQPLSEIVTTAGSDCLLGIARLKQRLIILLDLPQVFSGAEKGLLPELALASGKK